MRLTKSAKLLGYILAQYIDGDDEDPTRTDCVDLYIEDALPKHRAYLHRQQKVPTTFVMYWLTYNPALYCLLRPGLATLEGLATLKPLLIAPPNKACRFKHHQHLAIRTKSTHPNIRNKTIKNKREKIITNVHASLRF